MVGRLLRDEGPFYAWDHYPAGDVFDSRHGAQYFFHAHGAAQRDEAEHGHFHSFVRPVGTGKLHHLVAVSVDRASQPIRLFTVNCWVTEDSWIRAPAAIALLDRFILDGPRPSRWVNRWLAALLRLFRPQIEHLLHQRDAALADWHPGIGARTPLSPASSRFFRSWRSRPPRRRTASPAPSQRRNGAAEETPGDRNLLGVASHIGTYARRGRSCRGAGSP